MLTKFVGGSGKLCKVESSIILQCSDERCCEHVVGRVLVILWTAPCVLANWEVLLLVNEVLVKHESLDNGGVVLGSLNKLLQVDPTISVLYNVQYTLTTVLHTHYCSIHSFCSI